MQLGEDFNGIISKFEIGQHIIDEKVYAEIDYARFPTLQTWSIADYFDETRFPKREPIVDGLLSAQEFIILSGAAKIGKSLLALNLGISIAKGSPFLGHFETTKGTVLIIQTEVAPDAFRERLVKMEGDILAMNLGIRISTERISLDEKSGLTKLRNTINQFKPNLTIIDPFYNLHKKDEDKAAQIGPILSEMSQIAKDTGTALILVHHQGKRGESDGRQTGHQHRGSSAFADVPDGSWSLSKFKESGVHLSFELRNSTPLESLSIELDSNLWWRLKVNQTILEPKSEKLVSLVAQTPGIARVDLISLAKTKLGLKMRSVESLISEALHIGSITKSMKDGYATYFVSETAGPQFPRDLRSCGDTASEADA